MPRGAPGVPSDSAPGFGAERREFRPADGWWRLRPRRGHLEELGVRLALSPLGSWVSDFA